MSGLRHRGRHGFVTVRQHAAVPGMCQFRFDGMPWGCGWGEGPHPDRSRGNGLIRERLAVVGDSHRSIDPLFHLHLGCPDVVADLIKLPVVGDGPITAQDVRGFEAETPVHVGINGASMTIDLWLPAYIGSLLLLLGARQSHCHGHRTGRLWLALWSMLVCRRMSVARYSR